MKKKETTNGNAEDWPFDSSIILNGQTADSYRHQIEEKNKIIASLRQKLEVISIILCALKRK